MLVHVASLKKRMTLVFAVEGSPWKSNGEDRGVIDDESLFRPGPTVITMATLMAPRNREFPALSASRHSEDGFKMDRRPELLLKEVIHGNDGPKPALGNR